MEHTESSGLPSSAEPVLAVSDITATVQYWHHTLGFPDKWTWGEPPNHGGVSWNGVSIQFSLNPGLASVSKGNSIFISVKKLEALYHFHQNKNAEIVESLENKPWGMASYTVKELNGYYIIFAGSPITGSKEHSAAFPSTVRIVERLPAISEYQHLAVSVGWTAYLKDDTVKKLLAAPLYGVVAEDSTSNETIGCALVLGDNASFYYIKDLIVHPDWQNRHIGSALMNALSRWLEKNAANNSLVALITGEGLKPFYQPFGFTPAFSMLRYIHRDDS